MLYYDAPYMKGVLASVLKRDGRKYLLDRTILYEGGGGQPADIGYVRCGDRRERITHLGDGWHECDCDLEEHMEIELDWEFRYHMMKSHSAEHAFFRFLQERGARLIKISLGKESSIMFRGEIGEADILDAEERIRELIQEGRKIRTFWIEKEDTQNYPELRIKPERIKGDRIRVVEIEGHDISACRGIHVNNLSEISDFAVTRFRKGKNKEVKFIIGDDASKFHYNNSKILRKVTWSLDVEREKIEDFISNTIKERNTSFLALKDLSRKVPFQREKCGEIELFYNIFPGGDRKSMTKRIMDLTNVVGRIAIYADTLSQSISCAVSEDLINLKEKIKSILLSTGGKGGGGGRFLNGFTPSVEDFVELLKKEICKNI